MRIRIGNNLRLTDVPPELSRELMERMTFYNPKWLDAKRLGRWTGSIQKELKCYTRLTGGGLLIPRGFMRQILLLCRKNDIGHEIIDARRTHPEVEFRFTGNLKPFQMEAACIMLTRDFGTLSAPTGSGKTVMALYMIAMRRQPALVIVHTRDLARQWIERIQTFLGLAGEDVGLIGSGEKRIGTRITVAMIQTLVKCADEVAPNIGFLVVDECHRTPSRTFTEAVSAFDSKYMLGLSATPWRRDGLSRLIYWHLGDVHHEVDKDGLVSRGEVLAAEVLIRETNFKPFVDPVNDYSGMLAELTGDKERNLLIAADVAGEVRNSTGTCLILSDRKAHCETLHALLKYNHRTPSEILTGDVPDVQRREIVCRLNDGKIKVLIATGQLIGEGFDCGNLSTLFLTTPVKFSGRLLQYLGRVLRPAHGKKARVFDYVDVHVDVLGAAAASRRRVYGI